MSELGMFRQLARSNPFELLPGSSLRCQQMKRVLLVAHVLFRSPTIPALTSWLGPKDPTYYAANVLSGALLYILTRA